MTGLLATLRIAGKIVVGWGALLCAAILLPFAIIQQEIEEARWRR